MYEEPVHRNNAAERKSAIFWAQETETLQAQIQDSVQGGPDPKIEVCRLRPQPQFAPQNFGAVFFCKIVKKKKEEEQKKGSRPWVRQNFWR